LEPSATRQANLVEVDGLHCRAEDIDMVLNLIVSAYLLFDPHGLGHIDKNSVTNMISEAKGTEKKNAMLSQQRWDEMVTCPCALLTPHLTLLQDWDANGSIDFPEFVQAFSTWVDLDEED
jgi:hypothetical protein